MSRAGTAAEPSFDDRLIAECVRVVERDGREPINEPSAEQAARERGGTFEARITVRARSLSTSDELNRTIHQLRAGISWVIVLGMFIAFSLGAATAHTTMTATDETRINFYWVLGGVLGVQSILLLVWLIAAGIWRWRRLGAAREQADSPMLVSLGRLIVTFGQWVGTKLHPAGLGRAVIPAAGRVFTTGRLGFWTFSSITHAIWLAFNIGTLTLVLLLLSTRQYTFVWETTILSEQHYVRTTKALRATARVAYFPVPSDEDITLSQWTGPSQPFTPTEGASQRWASLLVASIVLYGFGPRLLLLGLSMSMRRSAQRRFRLDTSLPGYERLRPTLMPNAHALGVVDPDNVDEARATDEQTHGDAGSDSRPPGPPAIVGLEISPPATGWPPSIPGAEWTDLGIIESRDDRLRVIDSLRSSDTEPCPLVIVADLTGTPDRGMGHALSVLAGCVRNAPRVVLTAGQKLRDRGSDADRIAHRIADWRALAGQAGIDDASILELDLDQLTGTTADRLAQYVDSTSNHIAGTSSSGHLEAAFAKIERHARKWIERHQSPSQSQQIALHQEIAEVYRHQSGSFRSLLALQPDSTQDLMTEIKSGATRFVDLLPDRLRHSPRWLAAGALAGAFGCIATSAMISPIAIAALPSWSAIGAAVAAAIQPAGGDASSSQPPVPNQPQVTDAVRASALFAATLELQGHDEATITRVLDETFADEDIEIAEMDALHAWLEARRYRFDLSLGERS